MAAEKRLGTRAVRARFLSDVLLNEADEPWTGPVVRLADLTDAERRALYASAGIAPPARNRTRSEILTWMCANPFCRQWTMNGAHRYGRCNFCGAARPA